MKCTYWQFIFFKVHRKFFLNIYFIIQTLIESYYQPKYRFLEFCKDLEQGDELTVMLLARYLRQNIMSPFATWTIYPMLQKDIILMYDGRYGATQNLAAAMSNQSKDTCLLDMFLNKFPMIWVNILFFNLVFSWGMFF